VNEFPVKPASSISKGVVSGFNQFLGEGERKKERNVNVRETFISP
jgi:hypothetical protein